MRLRGKVAIITGAGRGLGRAAAMEMAREGVHVVVLCRTSSEIQATSRMIEEGGGKVVPLTGGQAGSFSRIWGIQRHNR